MNLPSSNSAAENEKETIKMNYSRDPYWTTARFDSIDANGRPVKKGDRIFYYPTGRKVLTGAEAERAAADFAAAAADEAFYNGQSW